MVETRSGKMQDPAQERIKAEESAKPQPVSHLRVLRQKEIQDQVSYLLKHDIISPSTIPYSSPVTLVRNAITPCVSASTSVAARVFSTVDISNAYYQIPIAEESQSLLSFVTQQGPYNFKRSPFVFRVAPQFFERVITQLIQKHHLSFIAHYYDDFVIFSDSSEQHLTHLRIFLKLCLGKTSRLTFKNVIFIKMKYIFSATTSPQGLTHLILKIPKSTLKLYNNFQAPPNCKQAFDKLNQHLATQPVLHLFQEGLPCQVYCDASTQGIAGVFKQVHPDGNINPVQYYSRALRSYERNYTISELECLAIVECVDKFRVYLLVTRFVIYSDHHALQWLKTIKDLTGRLFRLYPCN
ncbi:hypothetical protein LAZ67_2005617 [Cordylochernes scorpioides]|uniref:Reverse transcriptase domain-containing protein n=1 Tax=Cordylochernes scorpioides TaxID=51811 RepID=A0ABY6K4Q1_9ARAC|nr:hypothetical protein LAZ67_2005617 [Cordylochernes scorpioides]